MIVKESKQTRYGGKELELIQAAIYHFESAKEIWESQYPNHPMHVQEMIIEKCYPIAEDEVYLKGAPEEHISIRLDVDVFGLKYIFGIFVNQLEYETALGYDYSFMIGHENGEYSVDLYEINEELEKTIIE